MSKSNPNAASYIALLDTPEMIRKKISRAVTDSGREVKFDPKEKPEVSNLMTIYAACSSLTFADIEARYEGQGYGQFKKDLAEQVVALLEPIQTRYHEIRESGALRNILADGAAKAREVAADTVRNVKERMGFVLD
jgi:tryptophanyl-tRNA synthetase